MNTRNKLFWVIVLVLVLLGSYIFYKDGFVERSLHTDPNGVFSISYPAKWSAAGPLQGLTPDWRANTTIPGVRLATFLVSRDYMPGTNFSDAELTVGRSSDPAAVATCISGALGNNIVRSPAQIREIPFTKITWSEAGAGNLYDTTSYRAVFDGDCYAIEYTIHSTNIGNYEPGSIVPFDRVKLIEDLEGAVQSFKFLISSD